MKIHLASSLSAAERELLLRRPSTDLSGLFPAVREIFSDIARDGDAALARLTERFDGVRPEALFAAHSEFDEAERLVPAPVRTAIETAARNIRAFHAAQLPAPVRVETAPGVVCRREWRPLSPVGLYAPGGSAPLLSTVLMLGIPASIAQCAEIVLATPPMKSGKIPPGILLAARCAGITRVLKAGGAQAIAALALGTSYVPKSTKIFGPGNRYVTAAKLVASQPPYNVPIDMAAGPSEILILADESANPAWLAADLLAQAEHGKDSAVALVTASRAVAESTALALDAQLASLGRREIAAAVVAANAFALVVRNGDEAVRFANDYAPEHLLLAVRDPQELLPRIEHAGSVFAGETSSVVFGDYAAGTNHTLPTGGAARSSGALVVESFMKPILIQTVTRGGIAFLGQTARTLANAEGLGAHACAVAVREEGQ